MTSHLQPAALSGASAGQSSLPFPDAALLAVRLLPSEFARAVGVSKQCVSLWIKNEKVTLGADGRLNPQAAMKQLLRTGNPGRIRARIVRQAFADMGDLRAEAARASDLAQQLAALEARRLNAEIAADRDHETLERWLDEFARLIGDSAPLIRSTLDAEDWRAHVQETLARAMENDSYLNNISDMVATEFEPLDARGDSSEKGADFDGDGEALE
jgi:hypothetical protein